MASNYTDNRRKGTVDVGGRTYTRQKSLTGQRKAVIGMACEIGFGIDRKVDGFYAVICADQLQPSHLGASQNPLHFIPEAQPRNRSTSQSGALTPERIARSLRPNEVMEGATAYTGAPVVNSRGEIIQGNGRGYMLLTYYAQFPTDPKGYKKAITAKRNCFGFAGDPIKTAESYGIRKPVLVRMVDVPDAEAIALGQYTQADTEAIATSVTKIKAKARLLTPALQKRVIDELLRNDTSDEKTLAELIRESKVLTVLIREQIIRPDDLENYTRNGAINEAGVEFVSSLLLNATFRGSNVNTSDVFALLPVPTQNAIRKSLLYLLTATGSKSLNRELSNAIIGYREFQSTPSPNIRAWVNQLDIHGQTPADRYSPAELAMMDLFQQSTTQKQIVTRFRQYAQLVNDQTGTMFTSATKGQTKRQALATVFNATFVPDRRITQKDRTASTALSKLRGRSVATRRRRSAPAVASSTPKTNTPMTESEKKAFAERMAKARALKAKKGSGKSTSSADKPGKSAKASTRSAKPKAAKTSVKKAATAKSTSTSTKPKKSTSTKSNTSAAAKTKKTGATATKKRATAKKKATTARKSTATKKAATARSTVKVASRKEQKGKNFIEQVDKLADKIHQKSATGRVIEVPEYKISRSKAKKQAFQALSTARKTKSISNIKLKL